MVITMKRNKIHKIFIVWVGRPKLVSVDRPKLIKY